MNNWKISLPKIHKRETKKSKAKNWSTTKTKRECAFQITMEKKRTQIQEIIIENGVKKQQFYRNSTDFGKKINKSNFKFYKHFH